MIRRLNQSTLPLSPVTTHASCLSFLISVFSIIQLSSHLPTPQQGSAAARGTVGQKEAETENGAGKKIDSDSENDQDSVRQVCRFLLHSLLLPKPRPIDSSMTFKGRTSLAKETPERFRNSTETKQNKTTKHLTSLPKDRGACQFPSNASAKHFPSVNIKSPFCFSLVKCVYN